MSRSVIFFLSSFLCFNISLGNIIPDSGICDCNCVYNPDSNTCDCNCICEESEPLYVAYYFEDFNDAFDLDWYCNDFDFTHMSFTKVPGALTLTTQYGTYERENNNCKNVFYFNIPVSQALDFQVTTCISNYEPNDIWNQAGLLLFYDEDNFLKYVYGYGEETPGPGLILTAATEVNGDPCYGWFETEQYPQKMWLRIIKRGDLCELYNSIDGEGFVPLTKWYSSEVEVDNIVPCPLLPITKIGVFANNGSAIDARETDASFEFLEFRVLPIEPNIPEEPNEPNVTDVNDMPGDTIEDINICDCNCVYNPDSNTCDCNCICPELEPIPIAYLFDDFNEALDLSWTILNEDESHWSLTKQPGALTITTQAGSFEYYNTDYHNLFLIEFPVSQSMDFQITTCISNFELRKVWNQAGLVLWYDEENYVKFVYEYGNDTPYGQGILFTVGSEIGGGSEFNWYLADQTYQTTWVRIIRRGDVYEFYVSTDGENYLPLQLYRGYRDHTYPCLPVPIKNVGIFTSNYTSTTAPDVDASFEYFEFTTLIDEPNDELIEDGYLR